MKNDYPINVDAYLPPAMAARAEETSIKKANAPLSKTFLLAILAGAFISIGAIFATTVSAGSLAIKDASTGAASLSASLPFGLVRLLAGSAFAVGLILVVVAGAELFTGNNLLTIAFMSGKINIGLLLRNWAIVYVGNFIGATATALLVFLGRQYTFGNDVVGFTALTTANIKCNFTFLQATALGILCNALVCLAIWMCYSARSTTDKILSILPPISCFVAAGFEHSIANMYFIPIGLFIKDFDTTTYTRIVTDLNGGLDFVHLDWSHFLIGNLLPVTIGNIIGGALMVGVIYWFIYLRKNRK